jgi:anaphase-promoting complex subunit 4/WD40 domain-containing protein
MKTDQFRLILRDGRSYLRLFLVLVAAAITASPSSGGEFRLSEVGRIELPMNARAIAWHPDSKTIAAGGFGGMLAVWNVESKELLRDLKRTGHPIGAVEYSKDGKLLAVGKLGVSRGAYLTIFDTTTYQVMEERESPNVVNGRNSPVLESLSIDPKTSRKVAVLGYESGWDPVIFLLGPSNPKMIAVPPKPRESVKRITFHPAGEMLAVGRLNGSVDLYASDDGRLLNSFTAYDNWVLRALEFSPDGKFVFTGSDTGSGRESVDRATGKWDKRKNNEPIKMWNTQTLKLDRTFDPEGMAVWSLAVSPDGRYLYAGLGKRLAIWEVSTGTVVKRLDVSAGGLIVKASPNGKYLATTDMGARVLRIWSVAN